MTKLLPRGGSQRRALAVDLVLLGLAASVRVLFEHLQGLVRGDSDLATMFLPNFAWWWQRPRLGGGWNPWIFGGYPANADPLLGSLHPIGLLYAAMPPLPAIALEGILIPFFAAAGMRVYLGGRGCGRAASIAGALSFALGGFMAAHVPHPPLLRVAAATPWALAALDSKDPRALAAQLAIATALVVASGHPQTILYALTLVLLAALARGKLTPARIVSIAGGLALGVGLTAALWLPASELFLASTRSLGVGPGPHLGRSHLASLLFPGAAGRAPTEACIRIECAGYPGTVAWMAVLGALPALLRDRDGRFWLAIAVLSLVLSTGAADSAFDLLRLRGAARFLMWFDLAVAILAGLALRDLLSDGEARAPLRSRWVLSAGLLIALLWWATVARRPGAGGIAGGAVLAGSAAALLVARRWRWGSWLPPLILAVDLLAYGASLPAAVAPTAVTRVMAQVEALRVARPVGEGALDRSLQAPMLAGGNWASLSRTPIVQGYNALLPRTIVSWLGQGGSTLHDVGWTDDPLLATNHVLDLLRVRRLALAPSAVPALAQAIQAQSGRRWRPAEEEAPTQSGSRVLRVYENQAALPVAWLVRRVRIATEEAALALIRSPVAGSGFDPTTEALATEPYPDLEELAPSPLPDEVTIESYDEDEIHLGVVAATAALLVTSEPYHSGWTAEVDGEPVTVRNVNAGFRAVAVPAGSHDVRFRYRPWSSRAGLWIGCVSVAIVLGLWVSRLRRP